MGSTVTFKHGRSTYQVNKEFIKDKTFDQLKAELPHFPEVILQKLATPAKKEEKKEVEKPKKTKK